MMRPTESPPSLRVQPSGRLDQGEFVMSLEFRGQTAFRMTIDTLKHAAQREPSAFRKWQLARLALYMEQAQREAYNAFPSK